MAVVQAKEQVKQAEAAQQLRVDEKLMRPGKYEITKDTTFTVQIHAREKDGRWVLMTGPGKGIDTNTVVFRMWNYNEEIEVRKMATSYDAGKRVHMIDNDALNRFKVQRLMVSWTFDKDNPRLRIQHSNRVLTDESWEAFTQLQPNFISFILEEMNKVLEFNG